MLLPKRLYQKSFLIDRYLSVFCQCTHEVPMDSDEMLDFLFGEQARKDLERWGLPPDDEDEN